MRLLTQTRPIGSGHAARRRGVESGFTLIELLVCVAIIGIVTAIAIPNMLRVIQRSRITAAIANARTLERALHDYATDHNDYPVGTVPGVDRLSTTTLEPLVAQKYLSAGARDAILGSFHQGSMVTFVNDDTLTFIGQIRPRGAPDYALYITANGIFFRNASNQMEHI